MTQWLQTLTAAEIVTALVALGAVIGGLRWLQPVLKGVHHFLEDWAGAPERPGVPARPGVVAQIAALSTEIADLKDGLSQVAQDAGAAAFNSKSNHGTSSHDALMRELLDLRRVVSKVDGRTTTIARSVDRLNARSDTHTEAIAQSEADRVAIREYIGLPAFDPDDPEEDQ